MRKLFVITMAAAASAVTLFVVGGVAYAESQDQCTPGHYASDANYAHDASPGAVPKDLFGVEPFPGTDRGCGSPNDASSDNGSAPDSDGPDNASDGPDVDD